jgi:hypothetical protein
MWGTEIAAHDSSSICGKHRDSGDMVLWDFRRSTSEPEIDSHGEILPIDGNGRQITQVSPNTSRLRNKNSKCLRVNSRP